MTYPKLLALAAACCLTLTAAAGPVNLAGKQVDPFQTKASATVLLFIRTDCPITNRYAPELRRIASEFAPRGVNFWMVYPDKSETPASIVKHMKEYNLPGRALRDPEQNLVRRAHATIAPEAAVFNASGQEVYHGRIDNLYVNIAVKRRVASTHDLENAIADVLAGRPVKPAKTQAVGCWLADLD